MMDASQSKETNRCIVFFSRTGVSRAVARDIGAKTGSPVVELTDAMNWSGIVGYIKGGFYSAIDKPVEISFDESCLNADELIVVSPLWSGGPAPAVRAFLRSVGDKPVRLVLTNDGSNIEKAMSKTAQMFPGLVKQYGITKRRQNRDSIIAEIAEDLTREHG